MLKNMLKNLIAIPLVVVWLACSFIAEVVEEWLRRLAFL